MKSAPAPPVIFTAFANPHGDLSNLTKEQNGIQDALGPLDARGSIKHLLRTDTDLNAYFDFLRRWQNQIVIFHYAGHANSEALSLQNANTFFKPLAEELLARNPESLQLVFLNGCSTRGHVQTLFDLGVPAIIATSAAIDDKQAMQLAIRFYGNLVHGDNIEAAYKSAANYVKGSSTEARFHNLGDIQPWRTIGSRVDDSQGEFPWGLYVREDRQRQLLLTLPNEPNPQGNQNIIIQGVTDSTITVTVNGETLEILRKLDALQTLLEKQQAQSIQTADKIYSIGAITNANFEFIVGQSKHDKTLPSDLAQNLVTDENRWVQSLRQELLKQGVPVGAKPWAIFQHYGWLIEAFLQKMGTAAGQERTLRRLAFMAEAYQSTLRYLCYIQVAQVFQRQEHASNPVIAGFLQMDATAQSRCDYLNLLLLSTDLLPKETSFMPEINDFVDELTDTGSDLYGTALFLEKHRNLLLENKQLEGEALEQLLDEYLTGLVYWLRKLAFLAKYRLVSIKDISLNYRLGTAKNFVHLYGELHGMYAEALSEGEDYSAHSIEGVFTYNQSVLLFRGNNMANCLDQINTPGAYVSLSPLVVDQSVFAEKSTQTPEIFYYIGQEKGGRQYLFAQYKNELEYEGRPIASNKRMAVKAQNIQQPRLDELFEQLEQVFQPFKTPTR